LINKNRIGKVTTYCVIVVILLSFFEKHDHLGLLQVQATPSSNSEISNIQYGNALHVPLDSGLDKFGVKKIYETKIDGREWYVNMGEPRADPWFIAGDAELEKRPDNSWRVGGIDINEQFNDKYHIIIGVNTPPGKEQWRDVEITGYFKIVSASDDDEEEVGLQWYARGANHTESEPCQGTSLKGRLLTDGTANWKKEIWHDGGYTDARGTEQASDDSFIDKWIGWKVIMYNTQEDNAVKMESYIDEDNNNDWKQVTSLVDSGDWFASSSDEKFFSADCGLPKDYVVTNSGQVAAFRSDGIIWDFRDLSVREIQPLLTKR
jgi:hypothetical protein